MATAKAPSPWPRARGSAPRLGRWLLGWGLAVSGATAERPDWSHLLRQPPEWFRSAVVRRITANILSFQPERSDWLKNTDTAGAPFTGHRDALRGTFDNGATVNELRFLARACLATGDSAAGDFPDWSDQRPQTHQNRQTP